jgi:hypothetical protein
VSVKQTIDPTGPDFPEGPFPEIVSNIALGNLIFATQAARANALAAQYSMSVLGLAVLANSVRNLSWPLPFVWDEGLECPQDWMELAGKFSGRRRARKEPAVDPAAQTTL